MKVFKSAQKGMYTLPIEPLQRVCIPFLMNRSVCTHFLMKPLQMCSLTLLMKVCKKGTKGYVHTS